jgi:hypothetical protein
MPDGAVDMILSSHANISRSISANHKTTTQKHSTPQGTTTGSIPATFPLPTTPKPAGDQAATTRDGGTGIVATTATITLDRY